MTLKWQLSLVLTIIQTICIIFHFLVHFHRDGGQLHMKYSKDHPYPRIYIVYYINPCPTRPIFVHFVQLYQWQHQAVASILSVTWAQNNVIDKLIYIPVFSFHIFKTIYKNNYRYLKFEKYHLISILAKLGSNRPSKTSGFRRRILSYKKSPFHE